MSLVFPPEHQVHSTNSTDNVDSTLNSPEKVNKPTALIATVREDEPIVTRKELWSYYLYVNGDNGVGVLYYTQTLFQRLATAAGYNPAVGPGSSCPSNATSGKCVLPWMGGTKSIASVVLVGSGISFTIFALMVTTIAPMADYGTFGRWLLPILTATCWAAQYACIVLTERCGLAPDRWKLSMGLYIVGFVSYSTNLLIYTAIFPRLARNTPHSRSLREKLEKGDISVEEYEKEESLEKNRISNISIANLNIGFTVMYLLNLALLIPHKTAKDPKVDNYILVIDNSYWVLLGIWWFIFRSPRPGPPLPKGESYLTIGWKQIWSALKTYKHLPHTFVYLFAFFLLADGANTTIMLNTYLGLSQVFPSAISTLGLWYIQRHWKISTKTMLAVTNVVAILIPLWGMIGIWTNKFGFHNAWEFWAYNVIFGLFQTPYYAFSQTMIAELSPPGFENMFFGLFGLTTGAASLLGAYVVQAIIDRTGYNWYGFPFLFVVCTAASLVIWFGVDVAKGRRDAVKWAAAQRS